MPAHPKPLPDELLSSWLVRIAEKNGIKLHTLSQILFGPHSRPWIRDIDRQGPESILNKLCQVIGVSTDMARETTLSGFEGRIFPKIRWSGQVRWLLPVKGRSTNRVGYGLQFCPDCLASDGKPYFRRRWRLGFYTFCPDHEIMLHDCCHVCGEPIVIHRRDMGVDIELAGDLFQCTNCGADLRKAGKKAPVVFEKAINSFYITMLKSLNKNEKTKFNLGFFSVLHQLCKIVLSRQNTVKLVDYICTKLGITPLTLNYQSGFIEHYRLIARHYVVSLALWLLIKPEERIIDAWKSKAVLYNHLIRDFRDAPDWYWELVKMTD